MVFCWTFFFSAIRSTCSHIKFVFGDVCCCKQSENIDIYQAKKSGDFILLLTHCMTSRFFILVFKASAHSF